MDAKEVQVTDSNGKDRTEVQIAPIYGERSEVRELVERLRAGYPDAKKIPARGFVALATMALAHGLDPWNGEVWIIYNEHKDDTSIHVGIKGLRKAARKQLPEREHYYTRFKRILPGEYKELGLPDNTELAERCFITRTDVAGRYMELLEKMIALTGDVSQAIEHLGPIPAYEGIGVVLKGDKSQMTRPQLVKKRAESDALKRAFDLPFDPPTNHEDDDVINGEAWETNNGGKPELKLVPPPVEPVEEKPTDEKPTPEPEPEPEAEPEAKVEEPASEKEPEKPKTNPGPGPEKKAGSPKPKAEQKPSKPKKQATPPKVKTPGKPTQEDIDYLLEEFVPGSWKIAADTLNTIFGTKYTAETLKAGLKKHHGYLTDEDLEKVQLRWKAAVTLAQFDTSAFKKVADAAEGEAQGELF